jgi:hypothetical protein
MSFNWDRVIHNYWITVFIPSFLRFNYYKLFKSIDKTFKFQGKSYRYFYHSYNTTWNNERAVEIPLICKLVNKNRDKDILEIGNVLSNYFDIPHDIVDKYEEVEGVINQDVVDFKPSKRYGLIISISTLEHVGWDEIPRDPDKIFSALKNLKDCLTAGGELVVTLPIGLNPILDTFLETGKLKFTENYYLKRISKKNEWIELSSNFHRAKFGQPFTSANVLFIGIYHKPL